MKIAVPNYYDKFSCIADKCTHSCCVGWEIDIDTETMELYNSVEKIREKIEGDIPHFILQENEKCPFLNKDGLCDIICEYGEEALCDICYLHPRFKNFYSSFEEIGLGLCCEEAARIILTEKEKFFIPLPDVDLSEEEEEFFKVRGEIFSILQNREISIKDRLLKLADKFNIKFDYNINTLCDTYLSLEILDDKWTEMLNTLKEYNFKGNIFGTEDFQIPIEQLSVYFAFRHLEYGGYRERVKFILISCYLIGALWERYGIEEMLDIGRMYSSEIEYSDENLEILTGGFIQ